jgi:predicted aspartyl protease
MPTVDQLVETERMGEVRVQVRLTNAADLERVRLGELAPEQVRHYTASALVDTGATRSVLPVFVVEQLGLGIAEEVRVEYADGRQQELAVSGPLRFELLDRRTFDDAFVLGTEVIIGQTVLEKTDLLVDCKGQQVLPNPRHPDGPVFRL